MRKCLPFKIHRFVRFQRSSCYPQTNNPFLQTQFSLFPVNFSSVDKERDRTGERGARMYHDDGYETDHTQVQTTRNGVLKQVVESRLVFISPTLPLSKNKMQSIQKTVSLLHWLVVVVVSYSFVAVVAGRLFVTRGPPSFSFACKHNTTTRVPCIQSSHFWGVLNCIYL